MPRKQDTAEQIIVKLRQAEVEIARGQPVAFKRLRFGYGQAANRLTAGTKASNFLMEIGGAARI